MGSLRGSHRTLSISITSMVMKILLIFFPSIGHITKSGQCSNHSCSGVVTPMTSLPNFLPSVSWPSTCSANRGVLHVMSCHHNMKSIYLLRRKGSILMHFIMHYSFLGSLNFGDLRVHVTLVNLY